VKLCFISEVVNPREDPGHATKSYHVKNSLKRTAYITYNTNNYYRNKKT